MYPIITPSLDSFIFQPRYCPNSIIASFTSSGESADTTKLTGEVSIVDAQALIRVINHAQNKTFNIFMYASLSFMLIGIC